MTTYSDRWTDEQIRIVIGGLDRCSFFDERDQCRTVELGCSCCGKMFVEELGAAKAKVLDRRPFLCLECDPAGLVVPVHEVVVLVLLRKRE